MATYNIEGIKNIILNNPNRELLSKAREMRKKLSMHLYGIGMKESIARLDYFESPDIYKARKEYALSNKDLFCRILNEEDQVFTTRDGSVDYNMSDSNEQEMKGLTDDVRYGISLHNWVREFALKAYRSDPMGILFMEREQSSMSADGDFVDPKCYPTYKSSTDIYDYAPNGRRLEYVCFQLTVPQLAEFGIKDENYSSGTSVTDYFRFVDDSQDVIVKRQGGEIIIVEGDTIEQANPIVNSWNRVPAFIISDLMKFDDPQCFASPVGTIIELADAFLYDRSIRDLQKKYHGFAKAIEPLLKCGTCKGTGSVEGTGTCPDCEGTKYKLRTKISDVAKFPLEILETAGFDYKRIMGYVTPDIESWNKQDTSLEALEAMAYYTYWGVANTQISGFNGQQTQQDTATKTLANLQPKYARLNCLADWAEKTERLIADFIGEYWFEGQWKGATIRYGRNYILETPEEIMTAYQDMISKGAPDSVKDEQMRKYIRCLYQNSPIQQAKFLKLFSIEPFPHNKPQDIEASTVVPMLDKLCKRYFGEWVETVPDGQIIYQDEKLLREAMIAYAKEKQAELQPEIDAQQQAQQKQGAFGKN